MDSVIFLGGLTQGAVLEYVQTFVHDFLSFAGEPHLGLFLFVWFSAIFPLAPPEEAFTLIGGACIAMGILHPVLGGIAIIGGILATNVTQYWMGRGGLKLISGTRLGQRFIHSRSFRRAQKVMREKGIWAIVGCRFFFGTRAPTYVATGFLKYRFFKFFLVDSSVVLLHGIPLLILGYVFSDQIKTVLDLMKELGIWSLVLLVVLIAFFFGFKSLRARNLDADSI